MRINVSREIELQYLYAVLIYRYVACHKLVKETLHVNVQNTEYIWLNVYFEVQPSNVTKSKDIAVQRRVKCLREESSSASVAVSGFERTTRWWLAENLSEQSTDKTACLLWRVFLCLAASVPQ